MGKDLCEAGTVAVSSVQIIIESVLYSLYEQVEVMHLKVPLHNLKKTP